jgi:hypothetical protein
VNASQAIVAYRFPSIPGAIVCADPECTHHYADLMATVAIGMTQDDVDGDCENHDGRRVLCDCCGTTLSRDPSA